MSTDLDMTDSIVARSDQINADDLIAGPVTYTIREVIKGKAEAPFDFLLVETDRAYRPSKTMRRVIVNAWGPDASKYAGRMLTLYREPAIMFGGVAVGGIRISNMSHINGAAEMMAQTSRGKREKFIVQPLAAATTATPKDLFAGMSAQAKGELYDRMALPRTSHKPEVVKARLIAAADELGIEHTDEPDPAAILGAYRKRDREQLGADAADAFDHFAKTGHDLDKDPQTVIT